MFLLIKKYYQCWKKATLNGLTKITDHLVCGHSDWKKSRMTTLILGTPQHLSQSHKSGQINIFRNYDK